MEHPLVSASAQSQPAVYEPAEEREKLHDLAHAGRLLSSLRTHWRLFATVAGGFVVLVIAITLMTPKQYTATAKILVGGSESDNAAQEKYSSLPVLNAIALQNSGQSADTVAELVQEGPVVDKVVAQLNLPTSSSGLLGRISVKPVLNTPILSLSATWNDRERAAEIANTFATVLVERERDLVSSQAVAAQQYLQGAIADAEAQVQKANAALNAYQAKSQIADIDTQTKGLLSRVEADESKIDQLRVDEKQAQAQLTSAQRELASAAATIPGQQATDINPATTQLRNQLADVEVQLAAARQRYTPKHPAVVALEQQEAVLKRQIASQPSTVAGQTIAIPNPVYQQLAQQAATLKEQISGDEAQVRELQSERKALGPQLAALPAQAAELGFLQERAKLASDVYAALEQKYNDAVVAAKSAISGVTVVQPANPQEAAVTPNLAFNAAVALVVGTILGLLAVAIVEMMQNRIRSAVDVERAVGLPVIAHIPSMTSKDERAIPWLHAVTLESFLHLCASLRILGQKSDVRVVALTSPQKGEGKTTIAYQLACAMSRIRRSVLLIDGDLRCPATHRFAQIENGRGLADVLTGDARFDEVVVRYSPTLDILTAGTIPESSVSLIERREFDELLDTARSQYECIILDTPALNPVVDAALIATHADATAIVLSADASIERETKAAAGRLRALGVDNILGVILNRSKTNFTDYSDYFATTRPALPGASGAT